MLDITVKTLDGKNRTFSVSDDITVRQFKDHIASSIEIDADVQRLIFHGRVLIDEKKIDDYNVSGKTVHVVQKPPPTASRPGATSQADSAANRDGEDRPRREGNSFMLGSFSLPSTDSPTQINNLVQQMLSGMGEIGRGSHVTHSSVDGSSVDVHINMGRVGATPQSESQNRVQQALQMLSSATDTLDLLENPSHTRRENANAGSASEQSRRPAATGERAPNEQPEGTSATNSATNNEIQHPSISALANLLDQVLQVQDRLRPHLLRYRQLLNDDPDLTNKRDELANAQRLSELTAEAMHGLSHSYHHISDLMIDWNRIPPRHLRAPPAGPTTAIIQQTIPVQINLAHMPVPQMPPNAQPMTVQSGQAPVQQQPPIGSSVRTPTPGIRTESEPRINTQPGPRGAFAPHFRMASAGGAFPVRPVSGFPHGFHVFMEMAPGSGASGPQPTSVPQSTSVPQPNVPTSTTGQPNVQTSTTQSGTDPMSTFANIGAPGGPMLPPGDFLQNIIQMATNAALQGQSGRQVFMMSQPQNANSQQPAPSAPSAASMFQVPLSSATYPTSSASFSSPTPLMSFSPFVSTLPTSVPSSVQSTGQQQQQSASIPSNVGGTGRTHLPEGPPVPPGMPMPVPVSMPSMMSMLPPQFGPGPADLLAVDPYLPCHSRHFLARRAANAANHSNSTNQSPEQAISGIMSNVVSSIVRPLTELGSGQEPITTTTNPLASLFSSLASQGVSSSTSSATSSPHPTADSQGNEGAAEQEMFNNIMHGISGELQQVLLGQSNRSIGDFLNQLGTEYTLPQGEGLLTDLFRLVAGHLAFSDLMMIFFGQSAPLEQLRQPLREFVSHDLLNDNPPDAANVDAAIERVMQAMQPDITAMAAGVQTNDNIDYAATVDKFMRIQLGQFIRMIMNASESSGFAANLYECCRNFIHQFIVLTRYSLRGGQESLQTLLQERLRAISSEMNPAMQSTMSVMAAQQLQQILPTIRLQEVDVYHYVVKRDIENDEAALSSDSSFESACDTADDGSREINGDRFVVHPRISDALLSHLPAPPDSNSEADIEVSYGSDDWHSAVPNDWIPVITRDIVRQRRQAPQPSLSDAYMSGMPAKRRKIMARDRQREEFGDLRSILPNALQRAVHQAGVVPVTSLSDVSREAANSPRLCSAFQQEIDTAIRNRLANDPNYLSEKYPNAEKFFKSN